MLPPANGQATSSVWVSYTAYPVSDRDKFSVGMCVAAGVCIQLRCRPSGDFTQEYCYSLWSKNNRRLQTKWRLYTRILLLSLVKK
jgi:hypothetical protein